MVKKSPHNLAFMRMKYALDKKAIRGDDKRQVSHLCHLSDSTDENTPPCRHLGRINYHQLPNEASTEADNYSCHAKTTL